MLRKKYVLREYICFRRGTKINPNFLSKLSLTPDPKSPAEFTTLPEVLSPVVVNFALKKKHMLHSKIENYVYNS